jgi:hypothetical protein
MTFALLAIEVLIIVYFGTINEELSTVRNKLIKLRTEDKLNQYYEKVVCLIVPHSEKSIVFKDSNNDLMKQDTITNCSNDRPVGELVEPPSYSS